MSKLFKQNVLIADFMGYETHRNHYFIPEQGYINMKGLWKDYFKDEQLKFHKQWNWIMPVVKRVYECENEFDIHPLDDIIEALTELNLYGVHKQVVKFIKKYNEKIQTN